MATRTPPTHEEITEALLRIHGARLTNPLTALPWRLAYAGIRAHFTTNTRKAVEWLTGAVAAPDSTIVAVRIFDGAMLSEAVIEPNLTDLGWTARNVSDLKFLDRNGCLVLPGSGERGAAVNSDPVYLIRRDELNMIRVALRAARTSRTNLTARDVELTAFRNLHGNDLDTIRAVVDLIPADKMIHDRMLDAAMFAGGAPRFGDDAVLMLELRGRQISAFAALLRHIPLED